MHYDPLVPFGAEDPEMGAAIEKARSTIDHFLAAFGAPQPNQRAFLLKVAFEIENSVEHIWVADLDLSGVPARGVLANAPKCEGLFFMQPVTFEPAQITDWMFVENGYLVGGFTTKVIRSRLSPEERKALDASSAYKIPE